MSSKPTSKLMQSVDLVRRYMVKFKFGLFDGAVYKKAPEAKFTYIYCSTVNDFLHYIMGNGEVAEIVAPHVAVLTSLLSAKSCRIIHPIIIDYNYIEVLPLGTCFNIMKKTFEVDPLDLKGK